MNPYIFRICHMGNVLINLSSAVKVQIFQSKILSSTSSWFIHMWIQAKVCVLRPG